MRTPSLRRRVMLAALGVLGITLLVLDGFIYLSMRTRFDATLADVLDTRIEIARSIGEELPADAIAERLTQLGIPAVVHTTDGRELRSEPATPRFAQGGVPTTLPFPRVERSTVLSDGVGITVFATRAGVDAALRRLLAIEAIGTVAAILAAALLLAAVSHASLKPLREVVDTARRIAGGRSGVRLQPDRVDTELGSLAVAFDRMVDSLEAAIQDAQASEERSQRFLADAAHQLRTPLAGIRASVEMLLRDGDAATRDRMMGNLIRETARAGRLLTSLLQMARLQQGRPLEQTSTDVVALVGEEAERVRGLAPDLLVEVLATGGPHRIEIDAGLVREAVANLLDNARRHARARIEVAVSRVGYLQVLRVSDDGPGLPEGAEELVFERFSSLDGRGGSGLGLPIARAAARAHGGDLLHVDGAFELRLPVSPSTPRPAASAVPL